MLSKLLESVTSLLQGCWESFITIVQFGLPTPMLLALFVLLAVWLGSGFFAATVAELFRHRVTKHFILGLVVPYVYPLYLARHITMSNRAREESEEAQQEAIREARKAATADRFAEMSARRDARRQRHNPDGVAAEEAPAAVEETVAVEEAPAAAGDFAAELRQYLYNIPVDEDGERPGPFRFAMKGGAVVDVASIRALQDEFMICVVANTGKAIRIRFANVESAELLETE